MANKSKATGIVLIVLGIITGGFLAIRYILKKKEDAELDALAKANDAKATQPNSTAFNSEFLNAEAIEETKVETLPSETQIEEQKYQETQEDLKRSYCPKTQDEIMFFQAADNVIQKRINQAITMSAGRKQSLYNAVRQLQVNPALSNERARIFKMALSGEKDEYKRPAYLEKLIFENVIRHNKSIF